LQANVRSRGSLRGKLRETNKKTGRGVKKKKRKKYQTARPHNKREKKGIDEILNKSETAKHLNKTVFAPDGALSRKKCVRVKGNLQTPTKRELTTSLISSCLFPVS
jgi:hypothetical protein